jgi:hypothetical protein
MKLVKYKAVPRGSLLGFADLELKSGLILKECSFHESNGKRWCSPPAKPILDPQRNPVIKDGKAQYAPVIEFTDKDIRRRWSDQAVAVIEESLGLSPSKTPAGGRRHEQANGATQRWCNE